MQIGTQFSIAVHVLLVVEVFKGTHKVTSDLIASSVNTNPVIIRKIMGLLKEAGIIVITPGTGGIRLTRKPGKVSLLDIYRAIEPVKEGKLFKIHRDSEPACPVGANIVRLLENHFLAAQTAMEKSLSKCSLQNLLNDLGQEE
ncbi:MAG: Rrf2 family transcriptional regulator [Spirochaetaceae bacterium]|jgi:DNA-binding IscR family transcriptional regulator|nr:Rrf2 family transcriptional regulator [Spirochaetaceae bacterium]